MERDSAKRKQAPMFSGVIRYIPDALEAMARLSWKGNEKHNPGKPLHHCRSKSGDHGDCIIRHQAEFDEIDPDTDEYHAVAVFWRAGVQLQELLERKGKAKRAPGAYSADCGACNPPKAGDTPYAYPYEELGKSWTWSFTPEQGWLKVRIR